MIVLTATYKDGQIVLEQPLPLNLEGKRFQVFMQELDQNKPNRREPGSAKGQIWMAPDFNEPLEDFEAYYS
ncbi:MAG: DUF2281 domain-containing protein [Prochlorotrichaceae cyanobacterium]